MRVIPVGDDYFVAVDDEDYPYVSTLKWKFHKGYAHTTRWGRSFPLHRLIMRFPESAIDHIDRDTRNNQKANLRLCNHSQNGANQLRRVDSRQNYKGITNPFGGKRYRAYIKVKGVRIKSEMFDTDLEAALAYDEMAIKYHGEFACTNAMLGLL